MTNRLTDESSPYLLQHAENPVDWYPWSAEALARARDEDKPIFLSIGYSACHWCHVMEHESFEDAEIAAYLNEHFVSIKVDREERPDLDHIYMQAVMAMQGHGGWPLSAFLTPEQEIFYGGTYWPPRTRGQMPGFDRVLRGVIDAYRNRRDAVTDQSKQITQMLRSGTIQPNDDQEVDVQLIRKAIDQLERNFDTVNGGFGGAPKFPHPMDLTLLLRTVQDAERNSADGDNTPSTDSWLNMVEVTLQKMADGGIFDHLAGGFARYSVDQRWLVPHFEKMLYDNAQLANVYLLTYKITGNEFYKRICSQTLDYLLDWMTDDQGGFHSTEDADSEGVEGKFYVWSRDEVMEVLGEGTGARFCQLYDVTEQGNFEGENILNLPKPLEEFAAEHRIDEPHLRSEMREARAKLLNRRNKRVRPGKDDKVLVSWNALAIDAFANAAVQFSQPRYAEAATKSGEFIWNSLRNENGRLLHTWRGGVSKLNAYLDDYAYLIVGFLSLYRIEFDGRWIDRAVELADLMIKHFADDPNGGFYFTSDDHETLVARTKDYQDSSVPSGNSMAALALWRLGRICGEQRYCDISQQTMRSAMTLLNRAPLAGGQMLVAIHDSIQIGQEIVLVAGNDEDENLELVCELNQRIDQSDVLIYVHPNQNSSSNLSRAIDGKQSIDGQATLYQCQNYACQSPLVGSKAIKLALRQMANEDRTVESPP